MEIRFESADHKTVKVLVKFLYVKLKPLKH